jgi:hypothetical protein
LIFGVILDLNELAVGLDRKVSGREFQVRIVEGRNDFEYKFVLNGTRVKSGYMYFVGWELGDLKEKKVVYGFSFYTIRLIYVFFSIF